MFPDEFIEQWIMAGAINPDNADREAEITFWTNLPDDDPQWSDFRAAIEAFIDNAVDQNLINPDNANREKERRYYKSLLDNPASGDWEAFFTAAAGEPEDSEEDRPPNFQPPTPVADTTIPADARLLVVKNTEGGADEYFIQTDIGTAGNPFLVLFSIGDREAFRKFFPNGLDDVEREVIKDRRFNAEGMTARIMGTFDEIAGDDESLRSKISRQLAQLGLEDLPSWIRGDPDAMQLMLQVANGDLSESAFWTQARNTTGFQERFPWLEQIMAASGAATIRDAIDAGLGLEAQMRQAVQSVPGQFGKEVDQETLNDLIGSGWNPREVNELLTAVEEAKRNPAGMDALNGILAANGMDPVEADDYIDLIRGGGPLEVRETLADFQRAEALRAAGVDIDAQFAALLGSGAGQEFGEDFTRAAVGAALNIGLNLDDARLGRFGLDRDSLTQDLVAAAFNQSSPTGRTVPQIQELMARLARERQANAQGFSPNEAFTTSEGRLVILGG